MKIAFAGSPEVAVPALEAFINAPDIEVELVISRPDAPKGRGKKLTASAVSAYAQQKGIAVYTPKSLKGDAGEEVARILQEKQVEAVAVVAYGLLIPPALLQLPGITHGWINLHFSLLPRWRGAAPVQYALAAGDQVSGISIFQIESGLDTGPIYARQREEIGEKYCAEELLNKWAKSGGEKLVEVFHSLASGNAQAEPQSEQGICFAPQFSKADMQLDWSRSASALAAQVRSLGYKPGAWAWRDETNRLAINQASALTADQARLLLGERQIQAGEVFVSKKAVLIGCGQDVLALERVTPAGKKMMSALDWARGIQNLDGQLWPVKTVDSQYQRLFETAREVGSQDERN